MPADHQIEPHVFGHQVHLSEIVKDVHGHLVDREGFRLGETAGPRLSIHVAAHGLDGRQCLQGVEDFGLADIPRVNDRLGVPQGPDRLGPKEPVSIRDHPDASSGHSLSHKEHRGARGFNSHSLGQSRRDESSGASSGHGVGSTGGWLARISTATAAIYRVFPLFLASVA